MDTVKSVRIFCGYDEREAIGFHVFCDSVLRHASIPVEIIPVNHRLAQATDRGDSSTQFNYARFLVPYLSGFVGHSIWMDGADMLAVGDVAQLWDLRDFSYAVKVVKHDYTPRQAVKFFDQPNRAYPRKNWSSVMLFWNDHYACRGLQPHIVAQHTGEFLHRLEWVKDKLIGELPREWNVLAGEDNQSDAPKLIHYTNGIPAVPGFSGTEYAAQWWHAYNLAQEPLGAMQARIEDPQPVKRGRGRPRKVVAA